MAYAWTAVYGYYKDPNASGHDVPDLTGLNVSAFTITSPTTLYTIPESLELPSPKSLTETNLETATQRIKTLTEYNYITIIPYLPYNPNYPSLSTLYPELTTMVENLMPWAFIYSRSLLSACVACFGTTYETFAYLTDIGIIITSHGAMYSVDTNGDISLVFTQGNYFETTYMATGFNPQNTLWYANGRVDISFIYNGSWYTNYYGIGLRYDTLEHRITAYGYTIWQDTNRTSYRQNDLNDNLIGTASNPKYKYKTDPADPDTDPYTPPFTPLTPSGPGGGDGTHNPEHDGDPAPIPDITQLPSILDSTFITAWHVTPTQLNNLGAYLWSTNFWGLFSNIFINPFDVLIGLTLVPVAVTDNSTAETIKFGLGDSLVVSHRITTQFYEIDCGGFICDEIWGSYLDYQVRFQLYLPFIGYRPIQAVDVVGHTLSLKYHVDVITGSCIAYVLTDDFCTYTFTGTCAYNLPLTGQSFSQFIASTVSLAGSYAAAALAPESMAGAAALNVAGSTMNTLGTRPEYSRSGGMGGNSAFMGMRKPILLSYVPRACIPKDQNKIMGYPSYQTKVLNQVSGYTEVLKVHLDGISATDVEKNEIESYLIGGVIL